MCERVLTPAQGPESRVLVVAPQELQVHARTWHHVRARHAHGAAQQKRCARLLTAQSLFRSTAKKCVLSRSISFAPIARMACKTLTICTCTFVPVQEVQVQKVTCHVCGALVRACVRARLRVTNKCIKPFPRVAHSTLMSITMDAVRASNLQAMPGTCGLEVYKGLRKP